MKRSSKKNKPWTDQETEIVIEKIQMYPSNLKHAFEEASHDLPGRSKSAVSGHYYDTIRKGDRTVTAIASSRGVMMNVKNSPRGNNKRVQLVVAFLDEMTDDEKREVLIKAFRDL